MNRVSKSGEKIDYQNVKNPWNWSWCEKVEVLSIKEKLLSATWYDEDTINFMVGSTIRKVFRLYAIA